MKKKLITPEEFKALPIGTQLESISGKRAIKGVDYIDQDTRAGMIAWSVVSSPVLADSEWIANDLE
jgi:hypothetical protein